MLYNKLLLALALSAGFFDLAIAIPQRGGNNQGNNNGGNNNGGNNNGGNNNANAGAAGGGTATADGGNAGGDTTLDPAVIQTGSAQDGQADAEKNQVPSAT